MEGTIAMSLHLPRNKKKKDVIMTWAKRCHLEQRLRGKAKSNEL